MQNKKRPALRVAQLAVLVALAMALSFVERMIPLPVVFPGVKLGLANLAVLIPLYLMGWREALLISVVRVLLIGELWGSGFSIAYALSGAICSFSMMAIIKRYAKLHVVTVSIIGGLAHNLAQLAVAMTLVGREEFLYYLPIVCISGIISGALIGFIANLLIIRLKQSRLFM